MRKSSNISDDRDLHVIAVDVRNHQVAVPILPLGIVDSAFDITLNRGHVFHAEGGRLKVNRAGVPVSLGGKVERCEPCS